MTQHIELDYSDPVHEGFFDAIQELLGAYAPTNFKIERVNATTIKVVASTDNGQVGMAINGKYRWRTTETTAALPGGLPDGEHPIFVTASANSFGGPLGDPDEATDYKFGLQIKKSGETPATAHYREVGKVTVASGAITGLRQLVASVSGAQIESGALSSEGSEVTWSREAGGGLLAQLKPTSIADTKLVSPNNATYKTILAATSPLPLAAAAGAYWLSLGSFAQPEQGFVVVTAGGEVEAAERSPAMLYLDDADYAVNGKTLKLRLRVFVATNGTKPAITFTFGLYPALTDHIADANKLQLKFGTVVTGSEAAIAAPAEDKTTSAVSADFAMPADGGYVPGVKLSGKLAANSAVLLGASLQLRAV